MGFIQEFRAFAMRGNVVDMAVGVIIGGAFGKIVASLVDDVLMPPVGLMIGGVDFKNLAVDFKAATEASPAVLLSYGKFLQTVLDFGILALVIFLFVRAMNRLRLHPEAAPAPAAPPEPSAEEKLLTEIRDLLKHPGPRVKALLSPKELAAAIGVSESSIKRWVDEGKIEAHRTAGGHRRIALADAVSFLRESSQKLVAPALLGLPASLPPRGTAGDAWPAEAGERLFALLEKGAAAAARGLLLQLYIEGYSPAEIFDGPLRLALARIGHLWNASPRGIFVEHRAIQICLHAVQQLRALMPENESGPVAMGGTPAPDSSQMPSLATAIVLAEEGFHAVNLGPDLPLEILGAAVVEQKPSLVWVSANHGHDDAALEREIARLHEQATSVGAALAVGGLAAPRCAQRAKGLFLRGQSMAELVAFVRGLGLIR